MATVSVSRIIPAPQEEVWAVLSDVANARRWNPAWSRIEITARRQGAGSTFRAETEDGQVFDFEISGWVPPEYIAFSPIREESETYSIMVDSHAFRLQPAGEGQTHVEVIAHATARGLRGRITAALLWPGHQREGMESVLDSLEAVFKRAAPDSPHAETGRPPAD